MAVKDFNSGFQFCWLRDTWKVKSQYQAEYNSTCNSFLLCILFGNALWENQIELLFFGQL